jgi:hypothetical protein
VSGGVFDSGFGLFGAMGSEGHAPAGRANPQMVSREICARNDRENRSDDAANGSFGIHR